MKQLAFVFLAILVVGVAWLQLGGRPAESDALVLELEPAVVLESVSADLPEVTSADALAHAPGSSQRNVIEVPFPKDLKGTRAQADPAQTVSVKVILVEPSGHELTDLSGSVKVASWNSNSATHEKVGFSNGAFEVSTAGAESLSFLDFEFNGRTASLIDAQENYPVDGGTISLRVQWLPHVRLDVVSAVTGAHLSDITVILGLGWTPGRAVHPGPLARKQPLVKGASSPVLLEPKTANQWQSSGTYHVHSPGYAWALVRLNTTQGGERVVHLSPSGGLSIQPVGTRPFKGARLRVFSAEEGSQRLVADFPLEDMAPVVIDSLLPGSYLAKVQIGESPMGAQTIGEVAVEVTANIRAHHDLVLDVQPQATRGPLAGTLVLPLAWNIDKFALKLATSGTLPYGVEEVKTIRQSKMAPSTTEPGAWSFDFGELPAADYGLHFESTQAPSPLRYVHEFSLPANGISSLRVEIPEPADVVVRIVDGTTGQPAVVGAIHWRALSNQKSASGLLQAAQSGESEGLFTFRAPVGKIRLGAFGGEFDSLDEKLTLQPGENSFTYQLNKNCPLEIFLFDGETIVPFPEHSLPTTEHLDGNGEILYSMLGSRGFKTAMSKPGQYVFKLPTPAGFQEILPQTISVARGEPTVCEVQLERE